VPSSPQVSLAVLSMLVIWIAGSVESILHIAQLQGEAEIWGRFGQESRSFGQSSATGARYADGAMPHKHWRLRISLIWRVGT